MSVVTNLILHIGILEDEEDRIKDVNEFWEDGIGLVSFDSSDLPRGWYGGTKMLEANLYVGAFNYLDLDEFITHLEKIRWEYPEEVQVIVKEQEDDLFRIIQLSPKQEGGKE
jgi:protein associated with RNAse G/E